MIISLYFEILKPELCQKYFLKMKAIIKIKFKPIINLINEDFNFKI